MLAKIINRSKDVARKRENKTYLFVVDSETGISIFKDLYETLESNELLDILLLYNEKDVETLRLFRVFEDLVSKLPNVVDCTIRECNVQNPAVYAKSIRMHLALRDIDVILLSERREPSLEMINSQIPILTY
ncbi:MAG: hypothetical protein ACE5K4_04915 [Candidatus Hydrothermarchaeota archaeon]